MRAALFDWDGTLADTAEASYRSYVRLFAAYDIPFDRETYARSYSPNWYHTFRTLGLPEHHWSEADERWLAHFAEERIELIEGARELMAALAAKGIDVGIVTSGSRGRIVPEIEAHGLAAHVRDCVCGGDVVEKKPHPEALLLCLANLGIRADEAVYVGDSPEDIAMARAAGVYSIGIPGAYPNREALLAARPDAVAETLADVLRHISFI